MLTSILISLLTIAGSGVVSSWVTFKLASSKADRDLRLQKLEKMISVLETFYPRYAGDLGSVVALMAPSSNAQERDKAANLLKDLNLGALREIERIIKIFFPTLRARYAHLEECSTKLRKTAVRSFRGGHPTFELWNNLSNETDKATQDFRTAAEDLRESGFAEGSRILQRRWIAFVREQLSI